MLNKGYYDASRPDILGRWEVIAEGELDYIGPLYELVKGALRDETQ
jgi:hypothetical protein